jgi:hypothetical protein
LGVGVGAGDEGPLPEHATVVARASPLAHVLVVDDLRRFGIEIGTMGK